MKSKLIVALDVPTYDEAVDLVNVLHEPVSIFKVGSQLFTRVGPRIVEFLQIAKESNVFSTSSFTTFPARWRKQLRQPPRSEFTC